MASRLVALALLGLACACGTHEPNIDPPPSTTGRPSGGFGATGGSGTTGSAGETSLSGDLAFTPTGTAFGFDGDGGFEVLIAAGDTACSATYATHLVQLVMASGGGLPAVGSYAIDGAAVRLDYRSSDGIFVAASARSGMVTLNHVESGAVGGNFSADLAYADGGEAGALRAIFGAQPCP